MLPFSCSCFKENRSKKEETFMLQQFEASTINDLPAQKLLFSTFKVRHEQKTLSLFLLVYATFMVRRQNIFYLSFIREQVWDLIKGLMKYPQCAIIFYFFLKRLVNFYGFSRRFERYDDGINSRTGKRKFTLCIHTAPDPNRSRSCYPTFLFLFVSNIFLFH